MSATSAEYAASSPFPQDMEVEPASLEPVEEPVHLKLEIEEAEAHTTASGYEGPCEHTPRNLLELLNASNEGRAILAEQRTKGCLSQNARTILTKLIIQEELKEDVNRRIPGERLQFLSYEIKNLFPREYATTYYVPYQLSSIGSKQSAKGKLTYYLHNLRRRSRIYKSKGYVATRSTATCPNLPTGEVKEQLQWLRIYSDPWVTVEEYWKITRNARMNILSKDGLTIYEYFSMLPCLQQQSGCLLLLKDFDHLYGNVTGNLSANFPLLKKRLLEVVRNKAKTTTVCSSNLLLTQLLRLAESGEEQMNLALFLGLTLLLHKQKGKKSDSSGIDAGESFITHIRSTAEIEETIKRRREQMISLKKPLQPFIIMVGNELNNIHSYYVTVDQYFYKCPNIMETVDTCFKIIHVLNIEYPSECKAVWMFIQLGFYQMKTAFDCHFISVTTLLSELGVEEHTQE